MVYAYCASNLQMLCSQPLKAKALRDTHLHGVETLLLPGSYSHFFLSLFIVSTFFFGIINQLTILLDIIFLNYVEHTYKELSIVTR